MCSFNSPNTSQQFHTSIRVNRHISVHAAAEATDHNIQYLRPILRSGALKGCKIGQMRLIDMDALEADLKHVKSAYDRRPGPR